MPKKEVLYYSENQGESLGWSSNWEAFVFYKPM